MALHSLCHSLRLCLSLSVSLPSPSVSLALSLSLFLSLSSLSFLFSLSLLPAIYFLSLSLSLLLSFSLLLCIFFISILPPVHMILMHCRYTLLCGTVDQLVERAIHLRQVMGLPSQTLGQSVEETPLDADAQAPSSQNASPGASCFVFFHCMDNMRMMITFDWIPQFQPEKKTRKELNRKKKNPE